MLIGSRMLHPSSERETARWLNDCSSFPEFVCKQGTIADNGLHRAATLLWEHHDVIEKKLSNKSQIKTGLNYK